MTKQESFNNDERRITNAMDAAAEKKALSKALPHKFKTDYELIDLAEIVGYSSALADITEYVNNYPSYCIPASQLKEVIRETILELKQLKRKL